MYLMKASFILRTIKEGLNTDETKEEIRMVVGPTFEHAADKLSRAMRKEFRTGRSCVYGTVTIKSLMLV